MRPTRVNPRRERPEFVSRLPPELRALAPARPGDPVVLGSELKRAREHQVGMWSTLH